MGLSGTSGPARGAYAFLTCYVDTVVSGQTASEFFEYLLPAGMDIIVTDVQAYAITAGSAVVTIDVKDDGVSILTGRITTVAAAATAGTLTTTNPGVLIAGGSRITADATTGSTTAPSDITASIMFYPTRHPTSLVSGTEMNAQGRPSEP